MIAPRTSIAARPHRIRVQNPDPPVLVDGTYETPTFHDADPPYLFMSIRPATAEDLERAQSGTVIAMGTHVIVGPFHPQISTLTRLEYLERGRTHVFQVLGCSSPDLQCVEITLRVAEVVV